MSTVPSLLKGLQKGRCCPRTGSVDVTADFGVENWTEADPDGEFLRRAVQSERINSMPQSSHGPMDEQEPNTQPRVAHPRTAEDIPTPVRLRAKWSYMPELLGHVRPPPHVPLR